VKVTILRRLRQRKLIFNVNDNIHFIRLVGIVWHSRFMHPIGKRAEGRHRCFFVV